MKRTPKLTKAKTRQLLCHRYSPDEATAAFAILLRIENAVTPYLGKLWKNRRQLPQDVRQLLNILQRPGNPRGINRLIEELAKTGADQKTGIYRVYGKVTLAQEIVFRFTSAYRQAFESQKENGQAETDLPAIL